MCDEKDKLIRAVLQAFPEGLLVSQLGFEYKKLVGEEVQFRYYGYTSHLEYLRSLDQVCTVYDLESGDTMVKAKPTPSTAHLTRMIRHQKESTSGYNQYTQNALRYNEMRKNRKIPEAVIINLQKMLVDHENGVLIVNICRMYSTRFGQYLEIQHFGFQNIHEFVNDGLLMAKDFDIKNGKLFYTGNSFKLDRPKEPVQPFIVEHHVDWGEDLKENTPMYSVDQTVLALLHKGSKYSVEWTYVKSPRSIGLFLISEAERMHSLRQKMGAHYQLYQSYELIRGKNVIQNQIVVVQENNFWCRGRVVEIRNDGQYLITILDSGHNSIHNQVYKIRPGFLKYPFMGIKAFLNCSVSLSEPHRQEFKKVIKDVFDRSELLMRVEDIVKEKVQVKLFEKKESGEIIPLKYNFC